MTTYHCYQLLSASQLIKNTDSSGPKEVLLGGLGPVLAACVAQLERHQLLPVLAACVELAFANVARMATRLESGGNPGANLKSISHRCYPILVAFVRELAKETIDLPLGCLTHL